LFLLIKKDKINKTFKKNTMTIQTSEQSLPLDLPVKELVPEIKTISEKEPPLPFPRKPKAETPLEEEIEDTKVYY
jgi:hypothetical protein